MVVTERTEYKVVSRERHHFWVMPLYGEAAERRVRVARRDDSYAGRLQECITALSGGEIVEAVLWSPQETPARWRFKDVQIVSEPVA